MPDQGPGVRAFPYSRDVVPIMGAFIFVSVLELPVGTREASELRLYVDDPRAFVTAARERLTERRAVERATTSSR